MSTCLDLTTVLTLGASPGAIPIGGTTTLTATLQIVNSDAYYRLGGNGLSGRTVTLQRRAFGATTWVTVGTMPAASGAGNYAMAQSPASDMEYRAVFKTPADEGINGDTSPTVRVDVVASCSAAADLTSSGAEGPAVARRPMHLKQAEVPMRDRSTRPVLATLAVMLVALGCQAGAGGPAGATAGSSTPPPVAPSATAGPTPSAPAPTPAVTACPPAPSLADEPPSATLAADGGDPVAGQLGSYAWRDGGSDSPWLPGAPIAVGAGEPLTVTVDDGVPVAAWTARRVPAGTTNGVGAIALGAGSGAVAFAAPDAGSWSIQVDIQFGDDLGSAAYYWRLDVR